MTKAKNAKPDRRCKTDEEKREARVTVFFRPAELQHLEDFADTRGLQVAQWARMCMLQASGFTERNPGPP